MRNTRRLGAMIALPALLLAVGVLAFVVGQSTAGNTVVSPPAPSNPIVWHGQIPVGVQDTQAGALAFADSYLSVEQSTMEADPALYQQLAALDDAPGFRATDLKAAAAVRLQNPTSIHAWNAGGHGAWFVPAHKLEAFTGDSATIAAWGGGIAWGGGFTPQLNWALSTVKLRWSGGQWLVTDVTDDTASAPIPSAMPQATPQNTQPAWFDTHLAGFTAVSPQ